MTVSDRRAAGEMQLRIVLEVPKTVSRFLSLFGCPRQNPTARGECSQKAPERLEQVRAQEGSPNSWEPRDLMIEFFHG